MTDQILRNFYYYTFVIIVLIFDKSTLTVKLHVDFNDWIQVIVRQSSTKQDHFWASKRKQHETEEIV